jgi:hypothetical protein
MKESLYILYIGEILGSKKYSVINWLLNSYSTFYKINIWQYFT